MIIARMRNNPRDWRIEDLEALADRHGIDYRQPGTSHVTFSYPGLSPLSVPATSQSSRSRSDYFWSCLNRLRNRQMAREIQTLPRFEIRPLTIEEGGGYLIEFPEYPGCVADGETPEEAMREGCDALASYLRTLEELGRPVPLPGESAYTGQWRQRVPKSLHAALSRRADREGVSLNMLVTMLLAEGLGRRIDQ